MKNNKGFTPVAIVLIIIAVLAVGGVAYYAGKSSSSTPQTTLENNVNPTTVPIKITFPTAGVTLVEGKTYTITWTDSNSTNITYGLYLENDQAGSIRIGETSQKSYSWTVPSVLDYMNGGDSYHTVAPVDGYRISITNLLDAKTYHSQAFKIVK